MKPAIRNFLDQCTAQCRLIAGITAGEFIALFHSATHWDLVTSYLIVSAWAKDRFLSHRRRHKGRVNQE